MKYILILSLILVGCAKPKYDVDPVLEPYAQEFKRQANAHGVSTLMNDISIQFGHIDGSIAGLCTHRNGEDRPEIVIDTDQWSWMDDTEKELLIFHELGHCSLNQEHRDNSIMNPDIEAYWWDYNTNRAAYLDELFSFSF